MKMKRKVRPAAVEPGVRVVSAGALGAIAGAGGFSEVASANVAKKTHNDEWGTLK